jgi:hypothetical protein
MNTKQDGSKLRTPHSALRNLFDEFDHFPDGLIQTH